MQEIFSPQNLNLFWAEIARGNVYITTAIVIALLLVLRSIILRIAFRKIDDGFARLRYKRALSYLLFTIAFLFLLPVWLPSIKNVATFLGIFGAGFLIVTRDIWVSIAAWIYIMLRRPYSIGDRIEISGMVGNVVDIRLMETSIMEVKGADESSLTGRLIFLPNAKVFTDVLINLRQQASHTFRELKVELTNSSDWEKTIELLKKVVDEAYTAALAQRHRTPYRNLDAEFMTESREPRILVSLDEGNVILRTEFMAPYGQEATMTDLIWRGFLKHIQNVPSIHLAKK